MVLQKRELVMGCRTGVSETLFSVPFCEEPVDGLWLFNTSGIPLLSTIKARCVPFCFIWSTWATDLRPFGFKRRLSNLTFVSSNVCRVPALLSLAEIGGVITSTTCFLVDRWSTFSLFSTLRTCFLKKPWFKLDAYRFCLETVDLRAIRPSSAGIVKEYFTSYVNRRLSFWKIKTLHHIFFSFRTVNLDRTLRTLKVRSLYLSKSQLYLVIIA